MFTRSQNSSLPIPFLKVATLDVWGARDALRCSVLFCLCPLLPGLPVPTLSLGNDCPLARFRSSRPCLGNVVFQAAPPSSGFQRHGQGLVTPALLCYHDLSTSSPPREGNYCMLGMKSVLSNSWLNELTEELIIGQVNRRESLSLPWDCRLKIVV